MKIFDCHLHVEKGLDSYDLELENANIIFNSLASYSEYAHKYPDYNHSIIFDLDADDSFFNDLIDNNKIRALKVHSRLQQINEESYTRVIHKLNNLTGNVPVIYDAFYFGAELEYQPSLSGLIELIQAFPEKNFIVAHSGGYEVLKYFFHLREFSNVGFDLSFSLQYLHDTSCYPDLKKLMRYVPSERIFFGTDHPFTSPSIQLAVFDKISQELNYSTEQRQGILQTNWLRFTQQ